MDMLLNFAAGAITFGFLTAALFFLHFWKTTRDDLFLAFASAFALLAIGQALLALLAVELEEKSWIYLVRLAAFSCILLAIWRRNYGRR